MKCSKCGYENLLKANYCHACGNQFTEDEKAAAREKALIGKVEKAEEAKGKFDKVKDFLSLSFITDNLYVRIALIILPLIISLFFGGGKLKDITIMNSSDYDIYYNTDTDEYFLDMNGQSANLKLSVPSDTQYVVLFYTSPEGWTDSNSYDLNEAVVVQYQSSGRYEIKAVTDSGESAVTFYTV